MNVNSDDDNDVNNLPEFFNVYIHRLTFHRMVIPREFVCYMGQMNSGLAELTGPSRRTLRVQLVNDGEDFYFTDGWSDFVKLNLVQEGNFMFFKYYGDLKFSVVVYDESMCEKRMELKDEFSRDEDSVIENGEEEENGVEKHSQLEDDKTEDQTAISINPSFQKRVLGSFMNIPKSFIVENCLNYKSKEKMVLRTSGNSFWEVNIFRRSNNVTLCGGWSTFACDNCIRVGDICRFELLDRLEMMVYVGNPKKGIRHNEVNVATSDIYSLNGAADVSQAGHARPPIATVEVQAVTARTMIPSVNPSFTVVMKNYNVVRSFIVQIPAWFVKENSLQYMKNKSVMLRTDKDLSWPVKLNEYRLTVGWAAFVRSNNVKIGDTCQFELVNNSLEMKVYISLRYELSR